MIQSMYSPSSDLKQSRLLKPADTFITNVDGIIKPFVISEKGDPKNRFIAEKEISTFKKCDYDYCYDVNNQEVVQAKVISIENNKVVVQISLNDFDTLKELNSFYVNKLKTLGLLYIDCEFEFVITETQRGQLTEVRAFEKFEDEKEVVDFYEKLKNEIGN